MNDKDKLEIEDDAVPGGGPKEGEEVKSDHIEPAAVHPDYQQTVPGAPAPASTVEEGTASAESDSTTRESGSDDES